MSITNLDPQRDGRRHDATTVQVPTRNTAVYIDLENLFGGYAGSVHGVAVAAIVEQVAKQGAQLGLVNEIAVMKAYANWSDPRLGVYRREMMEQGIEPVQVFSFGDAIKNAADIELVTDAIGTAYESPFIDVFVIVSADGGFVPLVRKLHAMGRTVIVVSIEHRKVNKLLRAVADECIIVRGSGQHDEGRTTKQSASTAQAGTRAVERRSPLPGLALGSPQCRQDLRTELARVVSHPGFTDWHHDHATQLDQTGAPLNSLLQLLDEIDPTWRNHIKRWFPAAKQALAYALAETDWRLAQVDGVGPVLVSADSPHATPSLTDTELAGWSATTEALARVEPQVRLISAGLTEALCSFVDDNVSTERSDAVSFNSLYESAAERLDEYAAADVRAQLITLVNTGALITDDLEVELAERRLHRAGPSTLEHLGVHVRGVLDRLQWPDPNEVLETLALPSTSGPTDRTGRAGAGPDTATTAAHATAAHATATAGWSTDPDPLTNRTGAP